MEDRKNAGVGWDGKTLKEMLSERQSTTGETGYYYGLEELELNKENPAKLDRFSEELLAATVAGRETTRMTSASPIVREVNELAVALYTPEGDCILQSTGIIIHIPLMAEVIRWMIENDYEETVEIRPGDNFTNNDNRISGMHPADIYDIMPIFWEDELVGWVGTVTMEMEIGGIPGTPVQASATERFSDGIRFSCEKTAEGETHKQNFLRRIKTELRMPDLFLTSRRGALAANVKVKNELKRIIKKYGIDYYKKGIRELVERSRRSFRRKVKERTVPGKFEGVVPLESNMSDSFAPPLHAKDKITLVPWVFEIQPNCTYHLDFDGCGKWGWHGSNTSPSALKGGATLMLTQTIEYSGEANTGTIMNVSMNLPEGTLVNPDEDRFSTVNLFSWPIDGGAIWLMQQGRAFYSRGYVEEVEAGTTSLDALGFFGNHPIMGPETVTAHSEDPGAEPSGAFGVRDGISGHVIWTPECDMGNEEVWELIGAINYLGRDYIPNSSGWGKYRSGYGILTTYRINSSELQVEKPQIGQQAVKMVKDYGMFGGYPGNKGFTKLATNTNIEELIDKRKPLPGGPGYPEESDVEQCLEGEIEIMRKGQGVFQNTAEHGDVAQTAYTGHAGGLGDPLDRDLELIKKDLENNLLTPEKCREIYCVSVEFDSEKEEWIIDEDKTSNMREKRREERKEKGRKTEEWWKEKRKEILEGDLPPLLKIAYNESLEMGESWSEKFRKFWGLPENFRFELPDDFEPTFEHSDKHYSEEVSG